MPDSEAVSGFAPDWPLPPGVSAWITTRNGGCSEIPYSSNNLALHVGDNKIAVQQNRQTLLRRLPNVRAIQWLNQTHSNQVVEAVGSSVIANGDAVFSKEPGLACSVMTADCLPVLIATKDGSQVAAVHAGWRGLAAGILKNTLAQFSSGVTVYLGPAIGPQQFEVGPDVRQAFDWASDDCFQPDRGDRLMANIYQLARETLMAAGVNEIHGGEHCTVTDAERFYSYRREGQTGRMASLIWINR